MVLLTDKRVQVTYLLICAGMMRCVRCANMKNSLARDHDQREGSKKEGDNGSNSVLESELTGTDASATEPSAFKHAPIPYPLTPLSPDEEHPNDPYFDSAIPTNVTALLGKSAYLSCRVRNLANRTVSWVRHRDIHILTVASYTYTSDQRFQTHHNLDTDEWVLHIKWVQLRDEGVYECQISTQPTRSYYVSLDVVDVLPDEELQYDIFGEVDDSDNIQKMFADQVPAAEILGGPDLHVDKGSTINLTCCIRFSPEPPAYIFWYHHETVISYDSRRGGVSVITEKGDVTFSYLLIQNADISDSGKYSCSPSNAETTSVRVHVLNGEHPAAMQTGSAALSCNAIRIFACIATVFAYSLWCSAALDAASRSHRKAAAR